MTPSLNGIEKDLRALKQENERLNTLIAHYKNPRPIGRGFPRLPQWRQRVYHLALYPLTS